MTTEQMRTELAKVYPNSDSWAYKVRHMQDRQVVAIFNRFRREGKIKL